MSAGLVPETTRYDWVRPPARSVAQRWLERMAALAHAVREAWRRRRDRAALAQFDDRALSDIGIRPREIGHALRSGRSRDAVALPEEMR